MRRAAAPAAVAAVLLDLTAAGVLLPTIRTDLGSSASGGQWIMNAYLLALAVVLPLATSVRIDRRRLAAAGAATMTAGAVLSATAGSTSALVAGRGVAGAGVALLLACLAYARPAAGRSLASAAALPLAALAFGPLIGGVVAEHNWWHLYFWAGVPVAAVLGAAAAQAERPEETRRPPGVGELGLAPALVALTILLVQSEPWGLGSPAVIEVLGIAAIGYLVAKLAPERAVWAAAAGALAALFFLMPQYFELSHLIHPLRSGARLSGLTIAALAGGALGWRLRASIPTRALAIAGAAAASAGAVALYWIDEQSGNALVEAGLVLAGGGFGLVVGATSVERAEDLPAAAALGAALTLAFAGALFQHVQADQRAAGESFQHSLSRGVAEGAVILLPLAIAMGAAAWRTRPASSAAHRAAES